MPLYEYRCTKCGHQFEKIQTFSAADVKKCPVCQSAVERLISAPSVRFKGSGFYATDYNGKGKSRAGSSASPSGASPAAGNGGAAPASTPAAPGAPSSGNTSSGNTSSARKE